MPSVWAARARAATKPSCSVSCWDWTRCTHFVIPSHTRYGRGHAAWLLPGLDSPAASGGLLRVDHMPPLGTATTGHPLQPKPTLIATPPCLATPTMTNCSTPPAMGNCLNIGGGINLTRDRKRVQRP